MSPSAHNETYKNGHDVIMNGSGGNDVENVVVVGAGPAGLMLASNLARYGIKPVVVDDRSDKTTTGRADGLQPKTIETLKQLGLADSLIRQGVKIFDICFWNSTPTTPMHRTRREVHYPPEVDVKDPYILLCHQGMIEDLFIEDLRERGVEVTRSSPFDHYTGSNFKEPLEIVCNDTISGSQKVLQAKYLVGCDGARSKVRSSIPGAVMLGDVARAPWGVLDGVIETDFPDLWSKVIIHSEEEGTILCIPRERNMTRLYIELNAGMHEMLSSEAASQEFVMKKAQEIIAPFSLTWKSVEWFSVYKVGQRVANRFTDDIDRVFITGDAAHTHSPKAAQGMNVSMHDAFNLSWKLNLAIRGLALPSLLSTYSHERRKIAQDLINFDFEHANAFAEGDSKALAANFAANIAFISGIGASYAPNVLNIESPNTGGCLRSGALLLQARVTRYIDANPVDIQLDIPMLGQFRVFFFTRNPHASSAFLTTVSSHLTSTNSVLGRASLAASHSYTILNTPAPDSDGFSQPQRYTAVSKLFTPALITTISKEEVEIADLPPMLRESRWTFYLDDVPGEKQTCTDKWVGGCSEDEVVVVNVRPDGYVGAIGRWTNGEAAKACDYLDAYYGGFLMGEAPVKVTVSSWERIAESKQAIREAAVAPYLLAANPATDPITDINDVEELAELLSSGKLKAEEVILAYIKKAAVAHKATNCLTEICFEAAIQRARTLDKYYQDHGKTIGPLHGIPITLKDQFNIKGLDTTLGYVNMAFKPAEDDAVVVKILQDLGAVMIAKSNLPQSIMWCETENPLFGLTTNPRNASFTPGGSTGGEGALLSLKASIVGWGTDIGGSIRIPSSINGLYGFKPSSARMPYQGVPVSTEGQEHVPSSIGPMTRSLSSITTITKAVINAEPWLLDPKVVPIPWRDSIYHEVQSRPLVIGIITDDGVIKPHPPIERALRELAAKLKVAGHEVINWEPSLNKECVAIMDKFYTADGGEDIRRAVKAGGEPFLPHVEALINRGKPISVFEYWQLNKEKIAAQKAYLDKWNSTRGPVSGRVVDILLTPTMPHSAVPHRTTRWVGYTKVWNVLDYTALSFPVDTISIEKDPVPSPPYEPRSDLDAFNWKLYDPVAMNGHPVGLQIVGRRFDEEKVLGAAKVIEEVMKKY
ncbi:hypothetical protein B7463_g4203, partial [Scytalidium lignicola]